MSVLIKIPLLVTLLCTVYCKDIYISSNGNDDLTCGSLPTDPCKSLSYALKQSIITDNTTIFINGTIPVDSIVKFYLLSDITVTSLQATSVLQCVYQEEEGSSDVGLIFEQCSNVIFRQINISKCSINLNLSSDGIILYQAGTLINQTTNIILESVLFTNSIGTGLLLFNSAGNIEITNSIFANNVPPLNTSTEETSDNFIHGGAGLMILISACDLNATNCESSSPLANYTISGTLFHNNKVHLNELIEPQWLFSYGGGLSMLLVWNVFGNIFNIQDNHFTNNRASCGGGLIWHCDKLCSNNSIIITGCLFMENLLTEGGSFGGAGIGMGLEYQKINEQVIDLIDNKLDVVNSSFIKNTGDYAAGTLIYSSRVLAKAPTFKTHFNFINCTWDGNSGIISSAVKMEPDYRSQENNEFVTETKFENCTFVNNKINRHYLRDSSYTFKENIGIFLVSRLKVSFKGNNTFSNNQGTALYLSTSTAKFERNSYTLFTNNTGRHGGAIALISYSNIQYENNTEFVFISNNATFVGGAIFVQTTKQHWLLSSHSCFLEYADIQIPFNVNNTRFIFINNQAESDLANSIFLPSIHPCRLACFRYSTPAPNINATFSNRSCLGTFYFSNNSNQIATQGSIFKLLVPLPLEIIPGHKYSLPLQLLDDLKQDVTRVSTYQLSLSTSGNIQISRGFEFVADNTIELLGSPRNYGNLTLKEASFESIGASFNIILASCPPGYISDNKSCLCSATQNNKLAYNGIPACKEQENVATIIPGYWVGYILENANDTPSQDNLYTSDCPLGFCHYFDGSSNGPGHRYYTLTNLSSVSALESIVCSDNRNGTLCSQCKDGYSVYFHSNTHLCDHNNLCPWGPIFYILSELLPITVLFITILWFDVSLTSGPAYSLIFIIQLLQAMIVRVNGAVHFNPPFVAIIPTIIYNMLNLDFFNVDQLSYCLWKGAKTLDMITMRYVSVIYAVLLVIGFILIINNCSCRLRSGRSRELSINKKSPTTRRKYSVLHGLTSFLVICYFQCSRTTFLILNRESPRGIGGKHYKDLVFWDGTLEFFHGKHLLYAIPALFFLFLFVIPLPLVLIFDQFLLKFESFLGRRVSLIRRLQPWTVTHYKIKPLLDSFQGTFKDKYRFFSGLYFVYRIIILGSLVLSATALQYYFILEMILVAMITIQAMIQPFERKRDNYIALITLSNMAFINALTLHIYDLVSDEGYTRTTIALQWIQMCLIYSPLVVVVTWAGRAGYKKCIQKVKNTKEYSELEDTEFPEEIFSRTVEKN